MEEQEVMSLELRKVLVTGGTGFIGGRLVEKLVLEQGANVRVLVRDFSKASRIARFGVGMIHGEVVDYETMRQATEGCDVVFHCAFGNSGSPQKRRIATVKGTETAVRAAVEARVSRFVHVSTISVYGKASNGDLDETFERKMSGDPYGDAKLEAERLVFECHRKHGLPVTVVQPAIVYGPFAGTWTVGVIRELQRGPVVLVNEGNGLCNAVYVDDVVDAMLLAADKKEAVGEAFLISAEEPITWREFYRAYELMLGIDSIVSVPAQDIKGHNMRERLVKKRCAVGVYRLAKLIIPQTVLASVRNRVLGSRANWDSVEKFRKNSIRIPDSDRTSLFAARTRVRIDKAKRILGYQPQFDFKRGIELTRRWAAWANLL